MNHSFNVEIACKYGVEKAILMENVYFWIMKNKANKKNEYDGKYWTYNTYEAFAELFPYMKQRKIAECLRQMEEEGLLISYQKKGYDRTKRYTLSDYALSYFGQSMIQKTDDGTYEKSIIEDTENGASLNTDINTDVNKVINTDINIPTSEKQKKEVKHKYGEHNNILLTDQELEKLKEQFQDWQEKIENISEGVAMKGYKYKSHYLAILKWAKNENKKATEKKSSWKEKEDALLGDWG